MKTVPQSAAAHRRFDQPDRLGHLSRYSQPNFAARLAHANRPDRWEWCLLLAVAAGLLIACFGPAVAQADHYHAFADQRGLLGLPMAMDVLSNLPFAVAGGWGFWLLAQGTSLPEGQSSAFAVTQRHFAALFFGGLLLTTLCSGYYHLHPDNLSLAIDRLGMVVAFSGLLGVAVADRVSTRAAVVTAAFVLATGPLCVGIWAQSGNLLPWALLQGGGLLLIAALAARRPLAGAWGLRLWLVVAFYAAAKLLEMGDHAVFEWTNALVSGHSLKHVVAALAAWPVLLAVAKSTQPKPSEQATKAMHNAQHLSS